MRRSKHHAYKQGQPCECRNLEMCIRVIGHVSSLAALRLFLRQTRHGRGIDALPSFTRHLRRHP
jgi:hypothetical protein